MTDLLDRPMIVHTPEVTFRSGVTVAVEGPGIVRLDVVGTPATRLRGVPAAGVALLQALGSRGAVPVDHAPGLLSRLTSYLARTVTDGGTPLLLVEAVACTRDFDDTPPDTDHHLRLSRLAVLQQFHGELAAEAPADRSRVVFRHPALAALLPRLAAGTAAGDLIAALHDEYGIDPAAAGACLGLMISAGVLDDGGVDATYRDDTDPVRRQWEPADLVFHSRSRLGRTDAPFGGRFPFRDVLDPQPPLKPVPAGERIVLTRPEYDDVVRRDPTLLQTMEARRSVRRYGSAPIDLDRLGELLYRTARVRGGFGPRPTAGMPYAATSRPFPCGGGAYELELYLTVRRCRGLEPASYYYDPAGHALIRLETSPADREALLQTASTSAGGDVNPDVLVTITSRFQRVSWKYQAIAYAVTLKHVGVLYHSLYLVATALGLAPCGLGSGDSEAAARAFGLDYLQESSVGEFLLGSLPDAPDPVGTGQSPVFDDWRPGLSPLWQPRAEAELAAARERR